MNRPALLALLLLPALGFACSDSRHTSEQPKNGAPQSTPAPKEIPAAPEPNYYRATVIRALPHDNTCYTQGLEIHDGILYETGGLLGRSSVRKIDMNSWKTLHITKLPPEVFGEGVTLLDGKLFVLTWRDGRCLMYDPKTLNLLGEMPYRGEGWGLCNDGESLIMTNGTSTITFLSPTDFHVRRTISVFDKSRPLEMLNEVEYINGEIWANVYQTDNIVRINPQTGVINGWVDAADLLAENDRNAGAEVLNGIAYDPKSKGVYLTGKYWPKLFEVGIAPVK